MEWEGEKKSEKGKGSEERKGREGKGKERKEKGREK